jgi:hypothetical protein
MSYYKDFLQELPKRSLKLLNSHYELEKRSKNSNEVTLLISLAMPVFVITNEILNKEQLTENIDTKKLKSKLNATCENGIFNKITKNWEYGLDTSKRPFSEIESINPSIPLISSEQTHKCIKSNKKLFSSWKYKIHKR